MSQASIGNMNTAIRMVNAERAFIANIQQIAGCSTDEATKVLSIYRKHKVVKMDAVNGVISVKHGAFLDANTIRNAINA